MTQRYEISVGIIGTGALGAALGGQLSRANVEVVLANSRGRASLEDIASAMGPTVRAGTVREAAETEIVFLAIPWSALPDVLGQIADWEGRILVDPTNPPADSAARQAKEALSSSEIVARMAPGAHVVKAFNTLPADVIAADPAVAGGRRVIFLSGDSIRAKREIERLLARLGFASVDLGPLREGGRFQQPSRGPLPMIDLVRLASYRPDSVILDEAAE